MQERRLLNLPQSRQLALRDQFSWLKAVVEDEAHPHDLRCMSVTVFDHWLTRDEANELLENVPPEAQANRTARHAEFCALVAAGTPVLSFALRRRSHDRATFRKFTSQEALSRYLTPGGGKTLRHRHFKAVLPELGCAFFESWDDTHHFYFSKPIAISPIRAWATQCGLYVLEHS